MILKKGMSGPAVADLIQDLADAGFLPAGAAGAIFDRTVEDAVKGFQSRHIGPDGLALVVDGQAGPLTRAALDARLGRRPPFDNRSLPDPAVAAKPPHASLSGWNALQAARAEMAANAREIGGPNLGPFVDKYRAVTGAAAGEPWCASFVSWCFHEGNQGAMPFQPTAGARAVLARFKAKGWTFNATVAQPPEPGDVIVWWRVKPNGWQGHVGLVSGYADGIVHTIEGNKTTKVEAFHYKLGTIDKLLGFGRAQP